MTVVDEAYWRRYYEVHNQARFVDLVDTFYDPNALFANPRKQFRGRDALINYFQGAGEFAKLTLSPTEIWVKPGVTATELDFMAEAKQDIPNCVTGPLVTGQVARIKMAATYRMNGPLIVQAFVFWGQESN
ncbi:MAG: nuclear transport factor 2 family protein [Pseudomonadota bacterium]